MTVECACGCGAQCTRKWKRGHHRREGANEPYREEDRGFTTPCWIWQRGVSSRYGRISIPGHRGSKLAHRVLYERTRGPIPKGMVLDHVCRVRTCVNPEHLEIVTQHENTIRSAAAKAARIKALEERVAALEHENEMLRQMAVAK